MTKRSLTTAFLITCAVPALAWGQPPDQAVFPGDERPRFGRGGEDRLARMAEYLELSEAQTVEWQAISEQHLESLQARWEHVGSLRQEFSELADQQDPNLEQLGRVALDLHREMKTARESRGSLIAELEEILTPEQAERFASLQAAREFVGERGHRRPHRSRNRADAD